MLSKTKEGNGEWILLDFVSEIRKIVQNNIGSILKYEKERKNTEDLCIPPIRTSGSLQLKVCLLVNSDGVRIIVSKNRSLWPIWLCVANLPPVLRSSFRNLALACLWLGQGKPNWNSLIEVSFFS